MFLICDARRRYRPPWPWTGENQSRGLPLFVQLDFRRGCPSRSPAKRAKRYRAAAPRLANNPRHAGRLRDRERDMTRAWHARGRRACRPTPRRRTRASPFLPPPPAPSPPDAHRAQPLPKLGTGGLEILRDEVEHLHPVVSGNLARPARAGAGASTTLRMSLRLPSPLCRPASATASVERGRFQSCPWHASSRRRRTT